MLSALDCYELCVQSPRHVSAFLHALHGQHPTVLREDCCGTAALSRRWIMDGERAAEVRRCRAIDIDGPTLAEATRRALVAGVPRGVDFERGDCFAPAAEHDAQGCDIVFLGNFSIGYVHTRAVLVEYLRASKRRLERGNAGFGGGVFVCDIYGGAGAFALGGIDRTHPAPGRELVYYSWRHEEADPRTGMVTNSISFRVGIDGEIVAEYPRAFVYRWRLWSLAELRESMLEAGFTRVEVYKEINLAPGEPPTPVRRAEELGLDWIVCVAAWR